MQSTEIRLCSIPGCANKARERGLCSKHYTRLLRHGTTNDPVVKTCSVNGCDAIAKVRGFCRPHYQHQWAIENRDKTRKAVRECKARNKDRYREMRRQRAKDHPEDSHLRYVRHREISLARSAAWQRAHPEEHRQACRKWAESHRAQNRVRQHQYAIEHPDARRLNEARRRARKIANGVFTVTEHDVSRLLSRQGGRCAYCRKELTLRYHLDHVVPIARGGRHSIGNLVATCPLCNYKKGKLFVTEWRLRQHT